jgi:uncharacterized protein YjiS (DUF1127 family)
MTATMPVRGQNVACEVHGQRLGFWRSMLGGLARIAWWPVRVAQARRSFAPLAQMSDYELHDIGLTRQDLWNAASLPLDQDPTRYLAGAATDAARHRRGMPEPTTR